MRFIILFFLSITGSWAMDLEPENPLVSEVTPEVTVCGTKALPGHTCLYKEFYDSGVFEKPDPNRTLQVSKFYWRDIFTPTNGCGLNGETIYELINRYSLQEKSIISFGPGQAREERFFFFCGMNPVVLVDYSLSYLKVYKLNEKDKFEGKENKECEIIPDLDHVYFINSTQEHASVNPLLKGKFDVVFVSGSSIQEYRNICLKKANPKLAREWPLNQKVFVENIILTANCLKKSGLLIIQNWASGNIPIGSKNYLASARNQLEKNGVQLLEVYSRSKGAKGNEAVDYDDGVDSIHLYIGYKGSKQEALTYYEGIKKNEDIKSIFGSYLYSYPAYKTTKKAYSIM